MQQCMLNNELWTARMLCSKQYLSSDWIAWKNVHSFLLYNFWHTIAGVHASAIVYLHRFSLFFCLLLVYHEQVPFVFCLTDSHLLTGNIRDNDTCWHLLYIRAPRSWCHDLRALPNEYWRDVKEWNTYASTWCDDVMRNMSFIQRMMFSEGDFFSGHKVYWIYCAYPVSFEYQWVLYGWYSQYNTGIHICQALSWYII